MTDVLPRILTLNQARKYMGRGRTNFDSEVRPYVSEKKEKRAVYFDRLELDALADKYFGRNGRPEEELWDCQMGSSGRKNRTGNIKSISTSTSVIEAGGFAALAERVIRKRRNDASTK